MDHPVSAYLVQEQHYFMETVELKGLKYDTDLQDDSSTFSEVLSATLKNKVGYHALNFCTHFYIDRFC